MKHVVMILLNFCGVANVFNYHEVSMGVWLAAWDVAWVFFCSDCFMMCYNVCFDIICSVGYVVG